MGPKVGPPNVAAENHATATARSTGSQISARAPPTMASGAQPKKPTKNRGTMIVCKFWATATGIWKIAKTVYPKNNGSFRPYNSDSGPQNSGPTAKP